MVPTKCAKIFDCILLPTLIVIVNVVALWGVSADASMGDSQRIMYGHVAMAWLSLVAGTVAGIAGLCFWTHGDLRWDHWSQAVTELGWLSSALTLVTGSLWARDTWGTWWVWDPRLTTLALLWGIYSANLMVRSHICNAQLRAGIGAALGITSLLLVPCIVMATRWFRGIHPISVTMDLSMRVVLMATSLAYFLMFARLTYVRSRQIRLAYQLEGKSAEQSETAPFEPKNRRVRSVTWTARKVAMAGMATSSPAKGGVVS